MRYQIANFLRIFLKKYYHKSPFSAQSTVFA